MLIVLVLLLVGGGAGGWLSGVIPRLLGRGGETETAEAGEAHHDAPAAEKHGEHAEKAGEKGGMRPRPAATSMARRRPKLGLPRAIRCSWTYRISSPT